MTVSLLIIAGLGLLRLAVPRATWPQFFLILGVSLLAWWALFLLGAAFWLFMVLRII